MITLLTANKRFFFVFHLNLLVKDHDRIQSMDKADQRGERIMRKLLKIFVFKYSGLVVARGVETVSLSLLKFGEIRTDVLFTMAKIR